MDKLNKELIEIKKKLIKLDKQNKNTTLKYKKLQDKLHLFLDSTYDTIPTEKFIISSFWQDAYQNYTDGGYITNDPYISEVRFKYEINKLNLILKKHLHTTNRALDIGCGNGRYTNELAKTFQEVVGLDLSKEQIKKNKSLNTDKNITYLNENFISCDTDKLAKFDFIFVGDIFMYTNDNDIESVFHSLLTLLNKNGLLIVRESCFNIGYENYKSKNYVAYYRNKKYYKSGIFKDTFCKSYRNYGYNLYDLGKYFSVYPNDKNKIKDKIFSLEKIVKKYVNKYTKSSYFFSYKV